MGWREEHPTWVVPENTEGFLIFDAGFEDVSWHNDECPSFHNKYKKITVWILNNFNRQLNRVDVEYAICFGVDYNTMDPAENEILTENIQELLNYI